MGKGWIRLAQASEHRMQFVMPHMVNKRLPSNCLAAKGAAVSVCGMAKAKKSCNFAGDVL
jgi:hypothetical protein